MSDRFEQPESAGANDPRRIFIPAPSGPAAKPAGGTGAPPRPRPGAIPPGGPPPIGSPGGPGRPGPGGPPGPRDPYQARRAPGRDGGRPGGPPDTAGGRFSRFPRLRWRRVLLVVAILLVVGLVGSFLWVRSIFSGIERVDTEGELSTQSISSGTNYLIVGSDSREVIEGEQAGVNDGDFPGGQRSDTMVVLQVGGGTTRMMSIPRDLYVPIADTDESGKINAAFNGGPPRLLRTISQYLDIPIHRYVEVDFVSFAGMVDGLGGITIDFPHPATDANSGLNVTERGPVELDGEQALAYVRSRNLVEHIDGEQVVDGSGDIGRMERQQAFLSAVFTKLSETKNPISLASAFSKSTSGLRIDEDMGLFDAIRLGWRLRGGLTPEPVVLPVTPDRNDSGSVLILQEEAAQVELDKFR